ncbi:MAG TPA: M28 family peptidase [Armatimonadaceae bacterium]|nr:M28 family peptidase [Armatimonadaceae bacterium]
MNSPQPPGTPDNTPAAAPPSPGATAVAAPSFDATRAFADLKKQVAFGPRYSGAKGYEPMRDWLVAELGKAAGVPAKRQDFTARLGNKRLPMSNVYAHINPQAKKQVMLCAHWDTRPTADQEIDPARRKQPILGANDGASGVACLLEVARQLAAKKPEIGVQIVFFDGEDYGPQIERMFLGSIHYAKNPALPRPCLCDPDRHDRRPRPEHSARGQ